MGRDRAAGGPGELTSVRETGRALVTAPRADQWPPPETREGWSPSRDHFVRVIPGKGIGKTVGFRGAPTGPHATAELYRRASDRSYRLAWTISLVNPVAPIELFLTDRGYLVTLDNWHNMGYGKIVAFSGGLADPELCPRRPVLAGRDRKAPAVGVFDLVAEAAHVRSAGPAEPLRVGG